MTNPLPALRVSILALSLAAAASALTGCVPLVLGGAATTAVVVTDRRSSGAQLDDQNIAFKAESDISAKIGGDNTRINATAYDGRLLLTGDVPTEAAKAQAGEIAQKIDRVRIVHNQLTVGPVASLGTRTNDTWLSSKVRTALVDTKYVPSATINSTTDRGVVYLMGKVTQSESEYAANAVAGVSGVTKVVKLFDIISRDEAIRLSNSPLSNSDNSAAPAPKAPVETGSSPTSSDSGSGGGLEVMPIK